MTATETANGAAEAAADGASSAAAGKPAVAEAPPSQQDRLLFFASVLIGYKVEVQVSPLQVAHSVGR